MKNVITVDNPDVQKDNRCVLKKKYNVRITYPKNLNDPLIIEPIDPKMDFELDMKDPEIKPYFKDGKLNFIVKGNSNRRSDTD